MSLSNNLRVLRKKKGLSQEQLAEQLNVSRQAVSKWESDQGYPEMDKMIQLTEIFGCTLDQLIKENIEETNVEIKQLYDAHHQKMSVLATLGIGFILSGVCTNLLFEFLLSNQEKNMYFGDAAFLLFVMVGVVCFIFYGLREEDFNKKHKDLICDFYTQQEKDQFQKRFALAITSGVGLIIFGLVLQILLEGAISSDLANFVFLLCVTFSVCIFVYFGTQKEKFETAAKNPESSDYIIKEKYETAIAVACGCIMLTATIIYFIWSFMFDGWNISWIVFPIFGMLCGMVTLVILFKYKGKL